MSSKLKTSPRKYLPGSFLVATPFLPESPYQHSVVLVMHHNAKGALGFVIDDQLKTSLEELESFFSQAQDRSGDPQGRFPGIRMFTAVVRWPKGRLETEVDQGIWMVTPARFDIALSADDLWSQLLRQIGRDVLTHSLGIRSFPVNPGLN